MKTIRPGTGTVSSGLAATIALAAGLAASAAHAQSAAPAAPTRLQQRFDAANTTHDGHLTLVQARQGGLKRVARHFSQIDASGQGYVTLDEVRAYAHARAATGASAQ